MIEDEEVYHDPGDIQEMRRRFGGADRSIAARRAREVRMEAYRDRQRRNAGNRTEQTNIKLTPAGKKKLLAICERETELRGMPRNKPFTITDFMEEAMDEWEKRP